MDWPSAQRRDVLLRLDEGLTRLQGDVWHIYGRSTCGWRSCTAAASQPICPALGGGVIGSFSTLLTSGFLLALRSFGLASSIYNSAH
jgi:hypothetical protein